MTHEEILNIKQRYGIVGSSPALLHAIEVAVQVARTNLSVLITGENGVGKDVFSHIIHDYSPRKHGPCLSVNCGAFPSGTINSELFGHVKGAYTDARADRKGYFEEANGGTLFLDEVGELPLDTQAMLLRVLETGEFLRMGESKILKTDVRVVAATNVDLPRAIRDGRFREDLYYRLCGVEIHIPALRERREDIPLLFRKFVADFADQNAIPRITLTEEAKELLKGYYWGGNIRQLKNLAEQLCVVSEAREITADMLRPYLKTGESTDLRIYQPTDQPFTMQERDMLYKLLQEMKREIGELQKQVSELKGGKPVHAAPSLHDTSVREEFEVSAHPEEEAEEAEAEEWREEEAGKEEDTSLEQIERESIERALARNGGSRKRAAQELQISERTLYRKIEKYGL